ncbi:hypothetical protein KPB2_5531 [Klebsiella pneumoniae Kb677]|nr:hypothetical protein KPB2_5531 [Klebsiella pneumoniae Kb677]
MRRRRARRRRVVGRSAVCGRTEAKVAGVSTVGRSRGQGRDVRRLG